MISTVILATQLTFLQNKLFLMVLGKLKFRESNEIPGNQKQPFRGVLGKLCSENTQQIYRRTTPMPKCDFNKVALHCIFIEIILPHGCSPVNLQHIFRTPFPQNTSGRLLLRINYRLPEATIDTRESWTKPFKTDNSCDKNCKSYEIFSSKLYFASEKPRNLLEIVNSYKIFLIFKQKEVLSEAKINRYFTVR